MFHLFSLFSSSNVCLSFIKYLPETFLSFIIFRPEQGPDPKKRKTWLRILPNFNFVCHGYILGTEIIDLLHSLLECLLATVTQVRYCTCLRLERRGNSALLQVSPVDGGKEGVVLHSPDTHTHTHVSCMYTVQFVPVSDVIFCILKKMADRDFSSSQEFFS